MQTAERRETEAETLPAQETAIPGPRTGVDARPAQGAATDTPRFQIDSREKAEWLLRKLANLDAEKARVKAQCEEIVRGLDADAARLLAFHEADLREWARAELERRGGHKKTLPLLQGTVSFRTVPASLRVTGSREAIEHAKGQGWDVVRAVESLDAEAYRREAAAALAESGEVLPGVEIVPERESFSVRFGKEKGDTGGAKPEQAP